VTFKSGFPSLLLCLRAIPASQAMNTCKRSWSGRTLQVFFWCLPDAIVLSSQPKSAGKNQMSTFASAPDHRAALWTSMLTAEFNVCYWEMLTCRWARFDTGCKVVVALSASSTVAAWGFWAEHEAYWKSFSALACLVSVLHPFLIPSETLKKLSGLVSTWKELRTKYQLLWEQDDSLADSKNWKQFETAKQRESRVDETRVPKSKGLERQAQREIRRRRQL
jgi:hypothetical protein